MKGLISCFVLFSLLASNAAYAQPFGPPLYIADPASMKCRYYFAGNERHFNPRPENYTIDIGYTTEFNNEAQACEFFRCTHTKGSVKVYQDKKPVEKDLCVCPENTYWDENLGCVMFRQQEQVTFLQLILRWLIGIFS